MKQYHRVIPIILIAMLYAFASMSRNIDWRDEIAIWKDSAKKSPYKLRSLFNLARSYQKDRDLLNAEVVYLRAFRLFPENPHIPNNLGNVYNELGRYHEAIKYYMHALKYDGSADTHFNIAVAYERTGEIEKAIHHYKESLRLNPADIEAEERLNRLIYSKKSGQK